MLSIDSCGNSITTVKILVSLGMTWCYDLWKRYYFSKQKEGLDRYFRDLKSDRPQIYGIYWSRAQIEAHQDEAMAKTRSFLNRLWDFESNGQKYFHPDRECTYADRIRMREPGDQSLGLSPHMDAGSVERWLDPAYKRTYSKIFETEWEKYNAY